MIAKKPSVSIATNPGVSKVEIGIFVTEKITPQKVKEIKRLHATSIFIGIQNVDDDAIKLAKEAGIRINVETGIFVGEEWWQKYPDCRPIDKQGKPIDKIDWYAGICPNNPKVREERLGTIKSLVRNFDIDGLWLDFLRYPSHWETARSAEIAEYCFCKNCLKQFEREVDGKPEEEKWIAWKCEQITEFAREAESIIIQSGKSIELGMFTIPWRTTDYDDAIRRVIGQDFRALSKYINIFSPMTYHRFCDQPVPWIDEIVDYMAKTTQKPILPIIQTEDRAGKISHEEFQQLLKVASQQPSTGVIVFFLEDLLKDEQKFAVLKSL